MASLVGASVWEQHFYEHLLSHAAAEQEALQAYARLADSTASPAFAFLARLILEDEQRHHKLLSDLAETLRITSTFSEETPPVPPLVPFGPDREMILAETKRLLALEQRGAVLPVHRQRQVGVFGGAAVAGEVLADRQHPPRL